MIVVGISDYKITRAPEKLITYALGSCVGTCLFDTRTGLAGLSHILLPDSSIGRTGDNIMKYADRAIEAMLREMERAGVRRMNLTAKIAGGANMFANASGTLNIGERNAAAVRGELKRLGIRLVAEDTGKNYGRTLEFDPQDGSVIIKSVLHGIHKL